MSALDKVLKLRGLIPEKLCDQAAAELAQLRAELDEARKIMDERWFMVASTKDRNRIAAWLSKHKAGDE